MEIDEAAVRTIAADESEEAASTDLDQDNSMELSSDSSDDSDDLKMDEDQMSQFNTTTFTPTTTSVTNPTSSRHHRVDGRRITKSKLESTINKSLTLRNPGELISDFYISNMNYAMRYSVEYIQSVAKDKRRQREQSDSFINFDNNFSSSSCNTSRANRLVRSVSVDRLYAVRREHIRFA